MREPKCAQVALPSSPRDSFDQLSHDGVKVNDHLLSKLAVLRVEGRNVSGPPTDIGSSAFLRELAHHKSHEAKNIRASR